MIDDTEGGNGSDEEIVIKSRPLGVMCYVLCVMCCVLCVMCCVLCVRCYVLGVRCQVLGLRLGTRYSMLSMQLQHHLQKNETDNHILPSASIHDSGPLDQVRVRG